MLQCSHLCSIILGEISILYTFMHMGDFSNSLEDCGWLLG